MAIWDFERLVEVAAKAAHAEYMSKQAGVAAVGWDEAPAVYKHGLREAVLPVVLELLPEFRKQAVSNIQTRIIEIEFDHPDKTGLMDGLSDAIDIFKETKS